MSQVLCRQQTSAIEPNIKIKSVSVDGQRLKGRNKVGLTETVGDNKCYSRKIRNIMGNADVLITGLNNV
jgi:hypothetical protein